MRLDGALSSVGQAIRRGHRIEATLAEAVYGLAIDQYFRLISALSEQPETSQHLLALAPIKKYEQLAQWETLGPQLPDENIIAWTAATLRIFASEISNFLLLEKRIDQEVAAGEWEKALLVLDELEQQLGVSVWGLNVRTALITKVTGLESQKIFSSNLQRSDAIAPWLKFLSALFSAQAEPAVSAESFYAEVGRVLAVDLATHPFHQYAVFHAAFFGPFHFREVGSILHLEMAGSIIDRYLSFIRIGQLIYADSRISKLTGAYRVALRVLGYPFRDSRLAWLRGVFDVSPQELLKLISKEVIDAYDCYTRGAYEEALRRIDALASSGSAMPEDFAEIRALANVRQSSDSEVLARTPYTEILRGTAEGDVALANMKKAICCFSKSRAAAILHSFVERQTSPFSRELPIRFERFADVNGSPSNPRALYFAGLESVHIRQHVYPAILESTTFRLFRAAFQNVGTAKNVIADIPETRLAKYRAIAAFRKNGDERALKYFAQVEQDGDFLDRLDAAEGRTVALTRLRKLVEASIVLCRYVLQNPASNRRFPIESLCDALEVCQKNLPQQGLPIEVPNVFGAYSAFRKKDRVYRMGTLCEDFLLSRGVEKPTELRGLAGEFDPMQLRFFLAEVCLVSALDSHPYYISHREVEDQRVEVLQWLLELDPPNSSTYATEIAEITRRQKIGTAMQSVEKSKISVNVIGVKSVLTNDTVEAFKRFRSLPRFETRHLEDLVRQLIEKKVDEGIKQLLVLFDAPERTSALIKLYDSVKQKFLFSNDFGLDAYISVGIRHIILPSHLRACFERNDLITSKTSTGAYAPNEVWARMAERRFQSHDFTQDVQNLLGALSSSVDAAIQDLRDQIVQIKSEKRPRGLLDFSLSSAQTAELDSAVSECASVDAAVDAVIAVLWTQTDAGLVAIQRYLRGVFKAQLNTALDAVEDGLRIYSGARLPELEAAITTARTQLHDEIDSIAKWFSRGDVTPTEDFDFELAVETALAMVNRGHVKRQLRLTRTWNESMRLRAFSLNALVNILVLTFDNALRHGGQQFGDVALNLALECDRPDFRLIARNRVDPAVDLEVLRDRLSAIRAAITNQATSEKVRDEGGSGFAKMVRIMKIDLQVNPSIDIDVSDHREFVVTLRFSREELWV